MPSSSRDRKRVDTRRAVCATVTYLLITLSCTALPNAEPCYATISIQQQAQFQIGDSSSLLQQAKVHTQNNNHTDRNRANVPPEDEDGQAPGDEDDSKEVDWLGSVIALAVLVGAFAASPLIVRTVNRLLRYLEWQRDRHRYQKAKEELDRFVYLTERGELDEFEPHLVYDAVQERLDDFMNLALKYGQPNIDPRYEACLERFGNRSWKPYKCRAEK